MDTQSSTLVVVNPTLRRVRAVVENLTNFVAKSGDDHQKRMGRVMGIIIDETIDELGDRDEQQMRRWMLFMSRVLEWSSTGNIGILPQELIPFIAEVEEISLEEATRRWDEANGAYDMTPPSMTPTEAIGFPDDEQIVDAEIVE